MSEFFPGSKIDESIPDEPGYYDLPLEQQIDIQREAMRRHQCVNIPARYATAALDTWTTPTPRHEAILAAAHRYAGRVNADPTYTLGVILHGAAGSGKTNLAVSLMWEIVRTGRHGIFVDMAELARELILEYSDKEGQYSGDVIGDLRFFPIALIDDLGAERMTPDIMAKLTDIIHRRYNDMRITIITSNLEWPREFNERYGPQAVSRLTESCRAIAMPDIDFRKEQENG